jgi:hypothetical protein
VINIFHQRPSISKTFPADGAGLRVEQGFSKRLARLHRHLHFLMRTFA